MVKPDLGKTKTIKERTVYIYLPSLEMAEDWKRRAERAGVSLSRFVIERVEDSVKREEGEEGYLSRLDLIERLKRADEELERLRKDNELLRRLVDNLEKELKRYRARPFLVEGFRGIRRFDAKLVRLLKRGGTHSNDEILEHLGISPEDVDLVKAVNQQLELLERYGLIEYTGRGWRWKG